MKLKKSAVEEVKMPVRLVKETRKDGCRFRIRIGSNWYICFSMNKPAVKELKRCLGE